MKTPFLALVVCSTAVLGATEPATPGGDGLASTPRALFERGLVDELIQAPSGELLAWDIETGRGFVLGPGRGRAPGKTPDRTGDLKEFRGPSSPQLALSPAGSKAFLVEGGRSVEIHRTDGERLRVDVEQPMGAMVWLDDQRLALSPENGDHLVEIWDVEAGDLLQQIEPLRRVPETPGYRLLRATDLAWDPDRHRLHTLDAFTGRYRVFELPKPEKARPGSPRSGTRKGPPIGIQVEARIDDRNRGRYEERMAAIDRQLAERGEFQGASIWRFSTALDPEGTAWMVERCEAAEQAADWSAGTAHLLAVDPEGGEHRLTVDTACCSLAAVPWAETLAFARPPRPDRPGCFTTVPRPPLVTVSTGDFWLEATPLSPSSDARSRQRTYRPSIVRRLENGKDPTPVLARLGSNYDGLALVCTGGSRRPLDCAQLWVDSEGLQGETLHLEQRAGRSVTGRVTVEGAAVAGASIALTPAELRTTRLLTLPLSLPEGARKPVREAATDEGGRFSLPVLAPGDYRLVVELPGGRMDHETTFTVTAGRPDPRDPPAPLDLGALDFATGLSLEVAVTRPDGQPLPGALAGAAQAEAGRRTANDVTLFGVEAGEDGRAVIRGLSAELPVRVTCQAPGYSAWREDFATPPAFVDCTLDPLARLEGRIVTEDGTPLSEGQVTLAGGSGYHAGAIESVRLGNDDEGRFRFQDLEPARFRLVAASPGRTAEALSLTLEAGEARDVGDVILEPGERWLHRVVDGADGEPVAGATLTAIAPPEAVIPATTDAWGEVELAGPGTGPLTLEVRASGFAPRRVDVPESARSLDAAPHEIVLERGGWIVAHAWDEATGEPCAGCQISLSGGGPAQSLTTDGSGTARSEPLAPGPWQASLARIQSYGGMVTRSGGHDVRSVVVRPGATAEVRFGDPNERLEVVLSPPPPDPHAWQLVVRDAAGATRIHPLDASGSATIHRPRGGAALSLLGSGMTIGLGTLPEDATDPTLVDRPSGLLTGHVALSPEESEAGPDPVRLALIDLSSGRTIAEIETTAGARLRVPFLPGGVYELRADGRSLATVTLLDGGQTDLGTIE